MRRAAAGTLKADAATTEALFRRAARACALAAELDQQRAARHRIRWAVPTITPRADIAKLGLIRCEGYGHYWRPDEDHPACRDHPGVVHGPTPRDLDDAQALWGTRCLLRAADLQDLSADAD